MYLSRLNKSRSKLLEDLGDIDSSAFRRARDRYDIYFFLSQDSGLERYLAVPKAYDGAKKNEALFLEIYPDQVRIYPQLTKELTWSMAAYIREEEDKLSDDEIEDLYNRYRPQIDTFSQMEKASLAKMQPIRKAFCSVADEIRRRHFEKRAEKKKTPSSKKKEAVLGLHLQVGVELEGFFSVNLFLVDASGRKKRIEDQGTFFRRALTGGIVSMDNKDIEVRLDMFSKKWQEFIKAYIRKAEICAGPSVGSESKARIAEGDLVDLLTLIPGMKIEAFWNPSLLVPEPVKASVHLESGDRLAIDPALTVSEGDDVLESEKNVLLYKEEERKAFLLAFDSEEEKRLYLFFQKQGKESFAYVKDIFQDSVLPFLETPTLAVKETAEKKDEDFRIDLYVSMEEDGVLDFRTEYFEKGVKKKRGALEKDVYLSALLQSFLLSLKAIGGEENGKVVDQDQVLTFLRSDFRALKNYADVYLSDNLRKLTLKKVEDIHIDASVQRGFLAVGFSSGTFTPQELASIFKAYRQKRKFFLLKGQAILLDSDNVKEAYEAAQALDIEDGQLEKARKPFYEAFALSQIDASGKLVTVHDSLRKAMESIKDFKKTPLELTPFLRETLRSYQVDGVSWMKTLYDNHLSGILADEMGLGKTLQVIAFLTQVKEKGPVLVVCPKSLVYNWIAEFRRWRYPYPVSALDGTREGRLRLLEGIDPEETHVYVTSYESLRNDLESYDGKTFLLAILDEAQFIKNAYAKKSKAVKRIDAKERLVLTGTPVENSLNDLWSIFDFLMPGYLGDEDTFKERFLEPIMEGREDVRDLLVKRITPFTFRRTKKDVLTSLPPKSETYVTVALTDEQKTLYAAYLEKARLTVKESKKNGQGKLQLLAALTRLRQICVDPSSFLENYAGGSGKLDVALHIVQNATAEGHKVLLFSSFTTILDHFRALLEGQGMKSYSITGDTSAKVRLKEAEDFNKKADVRVMLVSLKAGGTGLNLQGADVVLHLDPWWNYAAEEQATDRAHRIGQTRNVQVYKLICHDTIEEKVVELQRSKKDLSEAVVHSGDKGIQALDPEDVAFLLD